MPRQVTIVRRHCAPYIEPYQQKNVEVEVKNNELEQERRNGSLVLYGSVVQV